MDGFTVKNANRFLDSGRYNNSLDSQSISVGNEFTQSGVSNVESQKSFADTLKDAVSQVNELQKTSDKAMQNLASGRSENIAEVMITAERADIALKLMMQVRNKIVEAYQEVMKMQV